LRLGNEVGLLCELAIELAVNAKLKQPLGLQTKGKKMRLLTVAILTLAASSAAMAHPNTASSRAQIRHDSSALPTPQYYQGAEGTGTIRAAGEHVSPTLGMRSMGAVRPVRGPASSHGDN
jgi:hypothetical protein